MPLCQSGTGEGQDHGYQQAKETALRLLGYRARSEGEIRRRLGRRHSPQVVDQVIATLREQGYLDDAAFARQWRDHRERSRPRGQGLLRQELLRFGVPPEIVREALADFDAGENAYRAGRDLAQRLTGSAYIQFRQRLWSHLQRRGFDSAVIGEAIARLWRELTDPLRSDVDTDGDEK